MSDRLEAETLGLLVDTIRSMQETQAALLVTVNDLSPLVAEHGDEIVALSNRIGSNYRAVRPLLVTKANLRTMTCLHCGNDYAEEPGVQLCGPCWARLGMPDTYEPARASRA